MKQRTDIGDWSVPSRIVSGFVAECHELLAEPERLARFRVPGECPFIQGVVDNTGPGYAEELWRQAELLFDAQSILPACHKADAVGSPETAELPCGTEISGTTARYAFICGVLHRLFGDLDGKRVAEIGGGYGGLACLLLESYPALDYACYDLPTASRLQQEFLKLSGVDLTRAQWPYVAFPRACDIIVSTCAFAELGPHAMAWYMDFVMSQSPAGMIQNTKGTFEPDELHAYLESGMRRPVLRVQDRPDAHLFPRNGIHFFYWNNHD